MSLADLLRSHVGAEEQENAVLAEQAAGDTIPVTAAKLLLHQVGADDGGAVEIEASVDDVIKRRRGELVGHLGAQIVDFYSFQR